MKYAILQSSLDVPDVEKLKRAFQSVPSLTAADAQILANDAFGILVKGESAEHASRLFHALQAEGIETEMVEQRLLPELPQGKFVRKLESTPEALILNDPLGRPFPLSWEHITFLAAGNVLLHDFERKGTTKEVTKYRANGGSYTVTETEYSTKEESRFKFLLDIIVAQGALRYTVMVDKPVLFQFLGAAFNPDLEQSFGEMVRRLVQHAPNAVVNRGAYYMRENAEPMFSYPSKNAYTEEIIWLLWRMKQSQA